ncbi:replication initiator protein A [Rhodococcus sp. C3V]|uniref:replication initiator protein A n=1 Tax=Rhodococcus sp. C3V TaxID=3034165 RepID=UPI0031FE5E99
MAYMLLKDKLEFSIKNEWIDEDNYIYFKYSNIALMQIFNYSEKTVIKIKKNLKVLICFIFFSFRVIAHSFLIK